MLEKKVYSKWAFTDNETEKSKINSKICKELEERFKICKVGFDAIEKRGDSFAVPTQEELTSNDFVYSRKACYGRSKYRLYKVPEELTDDEVALILDGGNLCFGYSRDSDTMITVWED